MIITRNIETAIEVIRKGGIIICGADTIFGMFGSALKKDTINRIYEIKGKNYREPLSFNCSGIDEMEAYTDIDYKEREIVKRALKQGSHFTFIAKKKINNECFDLISKNNELGVRIIRHPEIEMLTKYCGPIISTSANLHGERPVSDFSGIDTRLFNKVDLILESICYYGKPSSLYYVHEGRIVERQ